VSRVTVPRIFDAQVPDQWRGVSCRQARPGPSSDSGSGCCHADSKPRGQSPPRMTRAGAWWAPRREVAAPTAEEWATPSNFGVAATPWRRPAGDLCGGSCGACHERGRGSASWRRAAALVVRGGRCPPWRRSTALKRSWRGGHLGFDSPRTPVAAGDRRSVGLTALTGRPLSSRSRAAEIKLPEAGRTPVRRSDRTRHLA
jgi:hypothetical protein